MLTEQSDRATLALIVRKRLSLLGFGLAALMLLGLFLTAPYIGGLFWNPWDKLAHLGFYALVALLLSIGFGPRRWLPALLLACLAGTADEAYQLFLPGRSADLDDLLTDFAAAAAGVWAARPLLQMLPSWWI